MAACFTTTGSSSLKRLPLWLLLARLVVRLATTSPPNSSDPEQNTIESEQRNADQHLSAHQVIARMETWLGIKPTTLLAAPSQPGIALNDNDNHVSELDNDDDDDDDEWLTVEDCVPLSPAVYEMTRQLMVAAYRHPEERGDEEARDNNISNASALYTPSNLLSSSLSTSSYSYSTNPFLDWEQQQQQQQRQQQGPQQVVSLAQVFPSVRVTQWIRTWMEYNLTTVEDYDDDNDDYHSIETRRATPPNSFWVALLASLPSSSSKDANNADNNPDVDRCLRSLWQTHLDQLPTMQAQMLLYTQQLLRRRSTESRASSTSSAHQSQPPTSLQEQFQQVQALALQLQTEFQLHLDRLQVLFIECYRAGTAQHRVFMRQALGRYWHRFITLQPSSSSNLPLASVGGATSIGLRQENTSAVAISMTLTVLHRILLGMSSTTTAGAALNDDNNPKNRSRDKMMLLLPSYQHLLLHQLIPLHTPNGVVLWRDQTAILELYHEPLTQCLAVLIQKSAHPVLAVTKVLLALTGSSSSSTRMTAATASAQIIFPLAGNTGKQVLLLHEIDTLLRLIPVSHVTPTTTASTTSTTANTATASAIDSMMQSLLMTVARCMASDHSRVAERALLFFRNAIFATWIQHHLETALPVLLPALAPVTALRPNSCGGCSTLDGAPAPSQASWNPTVRKMTYYSLQQLLSMDRAAVERISHQLDSVLQLGRPDTMTFMHESSAAAAAAASSSSAAAKLAPPPVNNGPHVSSPKDRHGADHVEKAGDNDDDDDDDDAPAPLISSIMPPPPHRRSHVPPIARSSQPSPPPTSVPGMTNTVFATSLRSHGMAPRQHPSGGGMVHMPTGSMAAIAKGKTPPPLTVTGVAPWAFTGSVGTGFAKKSNIDSISSKEVRSSLSRIGEAPAENVSAPPMEKNCDSSFARLLKYMESIKPPEDEGGASFWSKAQMAETPTLLPHLKFHDLVFGHDLGWGAFGSVRYARLIDRTKTRSQWSEYAVKIISTEKIREMGYEASVQREIAILRVLSHPGIARLVSSFRFQEGAYLVLEYASGGDLHTLLRKLGSLDHDSTRFVMGEIIAALASIHDLGLVYADLKPENIVITEPGHVKLTDFGACRPVTAEARDMIRSSATHVLRTLRDGSWQSKNNKKPKHQNQKQNDTNDSDNNDDATDQEVLVNNKKLNNEQNDDKQEELDEEDRRIEGTTAYLPPEVVMGAFPTLAADSWALGCVMYQCLTGRPPLLEADDEATRHRIVRFQNDMDDNDKSNNNFLLTNEIDRLFMEKYSSGIHPDARDLIKTLLQRDPSKRPSMMETTHYSFFVDAGMTNVFALHQSKAHPLNVGNVTTPSGGQQQQQQQHGKNADDPNAHQWSRRQFSSIWAPQPIAYDIQLLPSMSDDNDNRYRNGGKDRIIIIREGDEAGAFFSLIASWEQQSNTRTTTTTTATMAGSSAGGLDRILERPPVGSDDPNRRKEKTGTLT